MEGDDNSVTMVDVLKEQEAFEEDAEAVLGASDDKNCTYPLGYIKRQALYACLTCCPESVDDPSLRSGVCLACSLACHEKHTFVELYTKRNFRCDCGGPKFKSKPCTFAGQKSEPNSQNQYNQNFSGLYCVCHRPYPDPDATEPEDEMIQCIVCEDWLHSQHLESKLPPPDQYSEMICQSCMANNDFLNDYLCYAVSTENKTDNDISMELNVTTDDVPDVNEKSIEQSDKVAETINPTENPQSMVGDVHVSNNEISPAKDQVESDAEMVSGPAVDNIELNAPIGNSENELDARDGNILEMQTNSSESEIIAESTKLTFSESPPNDVLTIKPKPIEEEESMEVDNPSAIEAITAENADVITQKLDENNTEKIDSDKIVICENLELDIQSFENKIMEVNEKADIDVETPIAINSSIVQNSAGEINTEQFEKDDRNTTKDIDNITETENAPVKDVDRITTKDVDNITESENAPAKDVDRITTKDIDNITESENAPAKDVDRITTKDIDNITETENAPVKDVDRITTKDIDNITETENAPVKDVDSIITEKSTDITESERATEKAIDDNTIENNSHILKDSEFATEKVIDNITTEKNSDNITETEKVTDDIMETYLKSETENESSTEKASDITVDLIIPPERDVDNVTEPEIQKNNTDIVTEKPVENGNDLSSKLDVEKNDKIAEECNTNIDIESEIKGISNPDSDNLQENPMSDDVVIDSKTHSENASLVDNEPKENLNIDNTSLEVTNPVTVVESNLSEILPTTQVLNSNDTKLCEEAETNVCTPDEAESIQMKGVSADNSGKDYIIEQPKTSETSDVAISDETDAATKELASVMTNDISNVVSEMVELMDTSERSDVDKASEIICDQTEEPHGLNQNLEQKGDVNKSDAVESISEDTQLEPAIEKSLPDEIGMCPNPESQLSATNHRSEIIPDSNDKPVDSIPILENAKISELVTDNSNIKDAVPKTNDSETTCEKKDKKRKLEHEHVTVKGIVKKIKREVMDCIRPAACLRLNHKGAAFWPSDWRSLLCSCPSCLDMYSEKKVSFLIDVEDTITAYEHLGKIKTETSSSQYEKGMDALSSLGHVQQINAITEYNRMKEKLLEFLKTFKDKKEVVKEEDIKGFFAGMKPKREPDGVYFCQ